MNQFCASKIGLLRPIAPETSVCQGALTTRNHGVTATFVRAMLAEMIKELVFHEALVDGGELQGILSEESTPKQFIWVAGYQVGQP